MPYRAPIDHMRFVLERTAGFDRVRQLPPFADATQELVGDVLENAARFATGILDPLNSSGDREGSKMTPYGVRTPQGFRDAYQRFVADGWPALIGDPEHGGQGLPFLLYAATGEMWAAANLSFSLCPELSGGAIVALERHASPELRAVFLPKLISGEWTGTMCLTEPQAGSDLSNLTTRAEPDRGRWRLRGRKIYITWGEHDLADNVAHLVLARAPDAPAGVKGISLFLVPRYTPKPDGSPGAPNDIRCTSVEHKMGIHASPTCAMVLGDGEGAEGWLIGGLHQGLACMFTMMNFMRVGVGLQGVGIADRAYQIASSYARERVQGRDAAGKPTAIVNHADVRRMLLTMKALTQAARGVAYSVAATLDFAAHSPDQAARAAAQARVELLTPLVKAWCTEVGIEVSSLAVQALGGMGYTEDAGAAQCYRDARITAIYEGTNAIQAQDLLGRKVLRDRGRALVVLLDEFEAAAAAVLPAGELRFAGLGEGLREAAALLRRATAQALAAADSDPDYVGSVAVNYLMLFGYVCGGWQWALAAAAVAGDAQGEGAATREARAVHDAACFYAAHVLPRARMHAELVAAGSAPIVRAEREAL